MVTPSAQGNRPQTKDFCVSQAGWVNALTSSQERGWGLWACNQAYPSLCCFYTYLTGLLHQGIFPEGLIPGLEIKPKSNEVLTGNTEFYSGHFKMHISWHALNLPSSFSPRFLTTFPVSETQQQMHSDYQSHNSLLALVFPHHALHTILLDHTVPSVSGIYMNS